MSTISVDYDVLNQRGSPAWFTDTFANIPTAGYVGRMFISKDTFAFYRDTGTGWDLIGGPGIGTLTGSGVAGQVSFFNGTQVLAGNNNLFWDNTNSRLGINTTTPGQPLDIHSTGNTLVQLNNTTTANSNISFQNQNVAKWRVGNVYNAGANSFDILNATTSTTALSISNTTNQITLISQLNGTSADFSSSVSALELLLDSVGTASATFVKNTSGTGVISTGSNQIGFNLNNAFFITSDNKGCSIFSFNHSSSTYTYTLPSANGTMALTSDLSSYLPLAGGTLTGQLYINPTNTGIIGLDVASNTTIIRSDNLEGFKRQLEIVMGSGTLVQLTAKGYGANYGTDLAFYTATTGGTNASPGIYITGTNNRVGIKTGTPAYDLDVAGTFGVLSAATFSSSVTAAGATFTTGTSNTQLTVNGTGPIKSGINFANGGTTYGQIYFDNNAPYNMSVLQQYSTGSLILGTNNTANLTIANGGAATFSSSVTAGGFLFTGPGAVLQASASVGTNSQYGLFSNGGGVFYFGKDDSTASSFGVGAYSTILWNSGSYPIVFATNNTERMRIINNGNISIGTATDFGYKLNLNGQPGANGYTAWTNWSDLRLKENIEDFKAINILDKIDKIRPVTYNYNELSGFDEETRNRRISGFIAQELKEVFPDMVGTILKKDIEYYDTNLSNLDLYLVKAIQELNKKLIRNNIN